MRINRSKALYSEVTIQKSLLRRFYVIVIVMSVISCKSIDKSIKSNSFTCSEMTYKTFKYDNEVYDDVRVEKCYYKNHLFKSIGIPDYNQRYSYDYYLYRVINKDTIKINNTDFFGKNYKQLEKIINEKLKASLDDDAKHEELKRCVESINFRYYNFNEFGMSFRNNNIIQFNIDYGISMACAPVANGMVEFELNELSKYID